MSEQIEFRFKNFHIQKSELYFSLGESYQDVDIHIKPKGTFYEISKLYTLRLELNVTKKSGEKIITLIGLSTFEFNKELEEEIPGYFTVNAPAISYPFLRSYVSALSALSGMDTINLPIMNLVYLKDELKANFERRKE